MIYWFETAYNIDIKQLNKDLVSHGFDGAMFPYQVFRHDYFTRISNSIDNELSLKYIVAIRPYAISPQYLSMICASINEMSKNKVLINLVSGEINESEKEYGGILDVVNDKSDKHDRHQYLLKYLDELNNLKYNKPDVFVSATKKYTLKEYYDKGFNCMIPFNRATIDNIKPGSVISVQAPIEKDYLFTLIDRFSSKGLSILLWESEPNTEKNNIFNAIKEYRDRKSEA
jgi:hypothetical protein